MKNALLVALALVIGCSSSKPAAKPAAQSQYKNLQVISRDVPREELIKTMRGFTRGLGVRCDFCHVQTAAEPKPEFDFPSDAKEEKRIARRMIQMAAQINGSWLPPIASQDDDEPPVRVSCWTSHRGKTTPELPPPPPQK